MEHFGSFQPFQRIVLLPRPYLKLGNNCHRAISSPDVESQPKSGTRSPLSLKR